MGQINFDYLKSPKVVCFNNWFNCLLWPILRIKVEVNVDTQRN